MEATNYYEKNMETGKLQIHTSKEYYSGLQESQKKLFKQYCLWSSQRECWVSKGKAGNTYHLKQQLAELGFEEHAAVGEKISFQQQIEKEQQRAEHRAERAEMHSAKATEQAGQLFDKAKKMAGVIPFGQPILVGHHSEQRDRNYRDRIHNTFGKSFEMQEKAGYYEEKAETARYTAEGAKFKNPRYLNNRIRECEKNMRILERRLKGKFYAHSPESEITPSQRDFYNGRLAEETEKLQFFIEKMLVINPEWKPTQGKKNQSNQSKKNSIG